MMSAFLGGGVVGTSLSAKAPLRLHPRRDGAVVAPTRGRVKMMAQEVAESGSENRIVDEDFIWDKSYQLEELEDKDHTTTALYLNRNGTVDLGATTGPVPVSAEGNWKLDLGSNQFSMRINRTFEPDQGSGEYSVERKYEGELTVKKSSDIISFDGKLILSDFPVGYFKMVSTADDLPDEHFKAV